MGTRTLPDMYALSLLAYISGNAPVPMLKLLHKLLIDIIYVQSNLPNAAISLYSIRSQNFSPRKLGLSLLCFSNQLPIMLLSNASTIYTPILLSYAQLRMLCKL